MNRVGMWPGLAAIGLLILGVHAAPLPAQLLRGRVVNEDDGAPVAWATVLVSRVGGTVNDRGVTDGAGAFRLRPYPRGEYRMSVERGGARFDLGPPLGMTHEDTFTVVVRLSSDVQRPGTLSVVSDTRSRRLESVGYYRRGTSGAGGYIGPGLIGARNWLTTGDLLRNARGRAHVGLRGPPHGFALRAFTSFRPADTFGDLYGAACLPMLFVDGARHGPAYRDVLDRFGPENIEGIEIYPTHWSTPPEYTTTGSFCGAVLIWLRT